MASIVARRASIAAPPPAGPPAPPVPSAPEEPVLGAGPPAPPRPMPPLPPWPTVLSETVLAVIVRSAARIPAPKPALPPAPPVPKLPVPPTPVPEPAPPAPPAPRPPSPPLPVTLAAIVLLETTTVPVSASIPPPSPPRAPSPPVAAKPAFGPTPPSLATALPPSPPSPDLLPEMTALRTVSIPAPSRRTPPPDSPAMPGLPIASRAPGSRSGGPSAPFPARPPVMVSDDSVTTFGAGTSMTRSTPPPSIVVASAPAPWIVSGLRTSMSPDALVLSKAAPVSTKWPGPRLTTSASVPVPAAHSPTPGPDGSFVNAAVTASRSEHLPSVADTASAVVLTAIVVAAAASASASAMRAAAAVPKPTVRNLPLMSFRTQGKTNCLRAPAGVSATG